MHPTVDPSIWDSGFVRVICCCLHTHVNATQNYHHKNHETYYWTRNNPLQALQYHQIGRSIWNTKKASMATLADSLKAASIPVATTKPRWSATATMKANVFIDTREVRVMTVPRPLITDPEDAILRVCASTICGSDLHLYHGEVPEVKNGDILGHEFLGIVDEVGPAVQHIRKGMRVVCSFVIACGRCPYCLRKEFSACPHANDSTTELKAYGHRTAGFFGYSHMTGGYPGGQSEYVRVPFADTNLLQLPDDISDEKALLLSDITPTAFYANEVAGVSSGDTVAVWGAGPVGILAAQWAFVRGAKRVAIIDGVTYRLRLAKQHMPNIHTINFKEVDVLDELNTVFPDGPGPDCGLECVGFEGVKSFTHKTERALGMEVDSPEVLNEMFKAVRPFGRLGIVGVYVDHANHVHVGAFMEKGLSIGSGQCPVQRYWKEMLRRVQNGEFDPTVVYTHKGFIDDFPRLYEMSDKKQDGLVKVFVNVAPGLTDRIRFEGLKVEE
ncbi:hypothetical protein SeMB42_g01804 [Synchytrium endobioticum]|uniref:Alcohol dehydrogenase-like N-terminal domain-containing protein n=1 Tax=Synchytrium endobioticum TaxID=286115 RepID=A0A507DKQ7_9FUNG|nr:hypothetical protein SeLEV6574_g01506 [Synchytrium endobioticum]TPX51777.1 hypothetical protein SeMB42_g01804 [Synchytrium endobioticum]